jgi:hypothetical protein
MIGFRRYWLGSSYATLHLSHRCTDLNSVMRPQRSGRDQGALNRSTRYERLSRPTGPKCVGEMNVTGEQEFHGIPLTTRRTDMRPTSEERPLGTDKVPRAR